MSFGIPVRNGLSIGLLASTFLTSGSGRLVPRLTLNFLTGAPLDSRITFTRSTTATFVGSDGLIQSSAINTPRFDYDPVTLAPRGLLIEEQRVNLLLYSEQFDNAGWTKSNGSVTANATTSPDGTTNADAFIENTAASAFHYINQPVTKAASSIAYVGSFYVKDKGRQVAFNIQNSAGSSGVAGRVNPATGTVTQNATAFGTGFTAGTITMTDVGNGWYRVVMTATSDTTTTVTFQLALHNGTSSVYTGDGVSGAFLYGAQLEAATFATSYIPTVASTVTRAADVAVMTGTNFSSWYNQSEGTMVASWATTSVVVPNALGVFGVSDATANERAQIRRSNTANDANFIVVDGGVVQYNGTITASSGINTSALAYKVNDFIGANNGTLGAADTSGTLPTPTQAEIGFGQGLTYLNGYIRYINYYATRLSNAQLQALTS